MDPAAEQIISQIQSLQAELQKTTDPERAQQLQTQLASLVEQAKAMGIIK